MAVPRIGARVAARIVAALAAATAFTALAGCGSSGGSDNPTVAVTTTAPAPATTSAAPGSSQAAGCQSPPSAAPSPQQFPSEPPVTTEPTTYTATVVTNCGTIVVALDGAKAPHTVNSFAFLADHHYFDNTPCHRLTTSGIFVLQCGDPTGTGTGGPGYTIPDENLSGAAYPAGTVAMANTGQPHTGGSQFFFVYADTQLPPDYTPFGTIVKGLDVLRAIAAKGSTPPGDGAPAERVVIESFTVTKGAPTG